MSDKLILIVVKTESFLFFKASVKLVLHGENINYLVMLSTFDLFDQYYCFFLIIILLFH